MPRRRVNKESRGGKRELLTTRKMGGTYKGWNKGGREGWREEGHSPLTVDDDAAT